MSKMGGNVTIRDVAREAGVGVGTVSRVLNRKSEVSPDSVGKVMQAVQATGYLPRKRSRSSGPTAVFQSAGDIGVLLFDYDGGEMAQPEALVLLQGFERALQKTGRNLLVSRLSDDRPFPHFLARERVDGLILICPAWAQRRHEWNAQAYSRICGIPHVWANARPARLGGDLFGPDFRQAGVLAARSLAASGQRRTVIIESGDQGTDFAQADEAFIQEALALRIDVTCRASFSTLTQHHGKLWELDGAGRFPGLFVSSWSRALRVAGWISREGNGQSALPEVITCVPDRQCLPEALPVRLTAIDLRLGLLCGRAVDQLIWRIANPHEPAACMTVMIEPELVSGNEQK